MWRAREEREAADDEYEGHYLAEEQSLRDVDDMWSRAREIEEPEE